MRFVYLGTSAFAAAVLEHLVEAGFAPSLVVSRPDSPSGRGRRLSPPPVAEAAVRLDLSLRQPEVIGDPAFVELLDAEDPQVLVLCAYGAMIREPLLSRWPILNLHPSLLPRWRGAAPLERAIMEGDAVTGVSIIRLVEELDAGPIAMQRSVEIGDLDFGGLSARLERAGAQLLVESLRSFGEGDLDFEQQGEEGITYAERISPADRILDPARPAIELERRVRALTPHIGARIELPGGELIGVRGARAIADGDGEGSFVAVDDGLRVGCGEGALLITRVLPPGSREMDASDWLRGHPGLG